MRFWPFRRRPRVQPAKPSPEAREAMRQAQRSLLDAERLDRAACDIADRLLKTRERNHFGLAVKRAIRGA